MIRTFLFWLRLLTEEWVASLTCSLWGHRHTPVGRGHPLSHCERCGAVNPVDWGDE